MNRRPRAQEGFTLIELTVSLVAGLIVALGIVGLSRDATHTFHEEMRSSAAEANLRTAIDRLRADLSRAGYMSTGNIANDPQIVNLPGQGNPITSSPTAANLAGLARLSSIWLQQGGSSAGTPLSAAQSPPMNPDVIDIAGNMTSTDQYEVASIQGGGPGGCQQIFLNGQFPSMYRILALGTQAQGELNNIFQPGGTGQFIVRLVEQTGRTQFLATCPGTPTNIVGAAPNAQPIIFISPQTPVQTAQTTGGVSGLTGYGSGTFVNPVQIVRWQLMSVNQESAQYQKNSFSYRPLTGTTPDPNKYDLVRMYIDAASGALLQTTIEVVAEYAVDLEFAFTVDGGIQTLPAPQIFAFDSIVGTGNNQLWAQNVVTAPPVPNQTLGPGPQRIRSVRVRLVTRAAEPDRSDFVPVLNPTGSYTYRYCVLPPCNAASAAQGILQYARARTVTTEVALPNQSRNFY